eukprot:2843710-Rhodomonas_salina.1
MAVSLALALSRSHADAAAWRARTACAGVCAAERDGGQDRGGAPGPRGAALCVWHRGHEHRRTLRQGARAPREVSCAVSVSLCRRCVSVVGTVWELCAPCQLCE